MLRNLRFLLLMFCITLIVSGCSLHNVNINSHSSTCEGSHRELYLSVLDSDFDVESIEYDHTCKAYSSTVLKKTVVFPSHTDNQEFYALCDIEQIEGDHGKEVISFSTDVGKEIELLILPDTYKYVGYLGSASSKLRYIALPNNDGFTADAMLDDHTGIVFLVIEGSSAHKFCKQMRLTYAFRPEYCNYLVDDGTFDSDAFYKDIPQMLSAMGETLPNSDSDALWLKRTDWSTSKYIRDADSISAFSEGFAAVDSSDMPSGYIDTMGNLYKIDLGSSVSSSLKSSLSAHSFANGIGKIYWRNNINNTQAGFMNAAGNILLSGPAHYVDILDKMVPDRFEEIGEFRDGIAIARTDFDYYYLINDKCEILTKRRCSKLEELSDGLRVFRYDGEQKYGYMDAQGNVVIEPQFYAATDFSQGYAAVRLNEKGKWGMINKKGILVLPYEYWSIGSFSEGLCAVSKESRKYGFVDLYLDLVIDYQYYDIKGNFHDGRCVVISKNGNHGCIDTSGNLIIPFEYDYLDPEYQEERIRGSRNKKYYLLDTNGNIMGGRGWDSVSSIFAGPMYQPSSLETKQLDYYHAHDGSKYYIINKDGEIVNDSFQTKFPSAWRLDENILLWKCRDLSQYVITDENLHIIGDKSWDDDYTFDRPYMTEDLIVICERINAGSTRFGFMDKNGNVIAQPIYESVSNFSEGYAAVKKDGEWFYIDKTGNRAFGGTYEYAGDFHEGRAKITVKNDDGYWSQYGYIDTKGNMVIKNQWNSCTDFSMGYAFVEDSSGWYMIDAEGTLVY
ncbi:MAG: WG repeat-containing protein [Clostridia bacterium]|nr:WG repeat-containing protein [Clostridia bacterium]